MMTGDLLVAATLALTGGRAALDARRPRSRAGRCCRCWPARRPTWRRRSPRPAWRRWNGSSTAPRCRPTAADGRGAPVHAQPERRHRSAAAASSTPSLACRAATSCSTVRRSASSTTARRVGSRTRWATSAPVIGEGAIGAGEWVAGVLLRRAPRRRVARARRAALGATRTARKRSVPDRRSVAVDRDRRSRSRRTRSSTGDRRRPRRRDGEGPRPAVRGRAARFVVAQGQARVHVRSRGAGRRVGPRPARAVGSPTSTSAPVRPTRTTPRRS